MYQLCKVSNNPVGTELVSGTHPTQTSLLQSTQFYLSGVNTVTCCFAEMSLAAFQALEKTAKILF